MTDTPRIALSIHRGNETMTTDRLETTSVTTKAGRDMRSVYFDNRRLCDVSVYDDRDADALQFIKRAVNSHGQMLAALKLALDEMRNTVAPRVFRASFNDAIDAIEAAITKAEGR